IIFHNGLNTLDHGIYVPSSNHLINGNIIFDNAGWGVHCYQTPGSLVITNNVIFKNGFGGIVLGGANCQLYHNTIVSNGQYGIDYYNGGCMNNVAEDNISVFNGYMNMDYSGDSTHGYPTGNLDDYNDYFGSTVNIDTRFANTNTLGSHEQVTNPV